MDNMTLCSLRYVYKSRLICVDFGGGILVVLVSFDKSTFFHMFVVFPTWLVTNGTWDFLHLSFSIGFLLDPPLKIPDLWNDN